MSSLVNIICSDPEYLQACKTITKGSALADDLYQEVILCLLEKSETKQREIAEGGYIKLWFAKTAWQMWTNERSSFSRIHRGKLGIIQSFENYQFASPGTDDEVEPRDEYDCHSSDINNAEPDDRRDIEEALALLEGDGNYTQSWFDRKILDVYMEYGSAREVSERTGIIRPTIDASIRRSKSRLKRKMEHKHIRILIVCPREYSGSDFYRTLIPHLHLNFNHPDDFEVVQIPTMDAEHIQTPEGNVPLFEYLNGFHIAVFSRQLSHYGNSKKIADGLRAMGTRIVLDIDDYWHVPSTHVLYEDYRAMNLPAHLIADMRLADHITTTTSILADEIRKVNTNVSVLPTAYDPDRQYMQPGHTTYSRTRIGWMGGICHRDDIDLLSAGIQKLHSDKSLEGRYQLILGGFNLQQSRWEPGKPDSDGRVMYEPVVLPFWQQEYVHFERVFTNDYKAVGEQYMKHLHRGNTLGWDDEENEPYRRIYGRPAGEYMQGYADFDIALAPLKANKFSRCKSQLKLIEAGFFKLPLICSATEPYTIDGKHGHNCLMVQESKGHKDWYRCMKMLLKDESLRRELGENLHKDVQKYHIREQIGARIDLYKHLY